MVNERERKLLQAANAVPIGTDLLEFSEQDVLEVGLTLAIRRVLIIVCDPMSAPKDVIPAARLIFQLNGKSVGGDEDPALSADAQKRISGELVAAQHRSAGAQ